MIRAVLWDLDNTLLDFDVAEWEALCTDFREFGLGEFTEDMLKDYMVINRRRWQALERGEMEKQEVLEGRFREFFGFLGKDTSIAAAFNDRYQELLGETICFRDDSYELLKSYQRKVLQCMASNGTKKAQTGKLKNSGFDKIFDLCFISEEIGAEKPSIDFFTPCFEEIDKWLMEREKDLPYSGGKYLGNIKKDEMIIIGDSLTSDIRGGNNAGIKCCWYNPKNLPLNQDLRIDYEIKSLQEVKDILQIF
ncbi:HAD hydrolase-like protein [Butyrivibrio sp. MC2021]|uniref:HAD hydrolase-like protein n=1 Tax=Butyrivibrio sp. MC2021 TaxID=1408306 RepID=UPI000563361B|nr:HAD hydrolase-like protein [Butyrivibrio sp. MC2021]